MVDAFNLLLYAFNFNKYTTGKIIFQWGVEILFEVNMNAAEINLMPSTEYEEILQNVRTILATVKGTVPLDREFGINPNVLDQSVNVVQARLNAAIVEAVNKFEPRARVRKFCYDNSPRETLDGIVKPRVELEIVSDKLRGYVRIKD